MRTAVTGKGKVSEHYTCLHFFLSPGENGSISFSWLANYQLFFCCEKRKEQTFLAGKMTFW